MVSTMEKARDALRGLTVERDGVNGASLYFYGEGWDFGEVGRWLLRQRCAIWCHEPEAGASAHEWAKMRLGVESIDVTCARG